jgi:hypothetical protein
VLAKSSDVVTVDVWPDTTAWIHANASLLGVPIVSSVRAGSAQERLSDEILLGARR